MWRVRGGVVLAFCGALIVASPAAGSVWHAGKKAPSAILAGSGVAWLTPGSQGRSVLYEARAGKPAKRIQAFQRDGGAAFAGSQAGVVLENQLVISEPCCQYDGGTKLLAGGFGERLAPVESCYFGVSTGIGRIDISGTRVAFVRCGGAVGVRDLHGGATKTVGASAHAARLAGRFVAWLEGDYVAGTGNRADIVVYDLNAGVESYRIPAAALPNQVEDLALQRDGKVAFVFDPSADDTNPRALVGWASPAEPRVHKLPLARRYSYSVSLARDRIVFARDSKAARRAFEETGVTDLRGHARLFQRHAVGRGIDFNGREIAYTDRGCRGYRVMRRRLPSSGQTLKPPRCN
jgi:hypothetical protein